MRIAMIVNSFPSISEKFLLNSIVKLLEDGIDIDVYAAVRSADSRTHDLFTAHDLDRKTTQLDIPLSMKKRILKFPFLLLRAFARSPRNVLRCFSFSRYHRASKSLKNLYFLNAFSGKKYDIIHCQFGQNGLIGAFLKDCGFCDKLVVTFHGSDITVFPKKEGHNVYDYMFSRVDCVTAGTNFTAGLIASHGCPHEKIRIIPAGIIPEDYPFATSSRREPRLILSVGRLEEVKGFSYAIRAFHQIAEEFPDVRYIIAGGGSKEADLRSIILDCGLEQRVFLVGEKKDTEIIDLYQRASIFLAPSIRASNGSEEGQGLVIQEAEISGIPVIGTLTGGIPEGIEDNITGYLVAEKDPAAISGKLRILLQNAELANDMGEKGRSFALRKFSMNELTEKLVSSYRDILKNN